MRQIGQFAAWARALDNRVFGESQGWRRPKWSTIAWTIPVIVGSQLLIRVSVGLATVFVVVCVASFLPLAIWDRRRQERRDRAATGTVPRPESAR
jgi:hypothetical protein